MSDQKKLPFKAFLSHRYKSPEVNLYFFDLFSDVAEVQFEVDEGTFSTNVTRLERMIRDADAFIGIYPFPGSWEESQSLAELRKASRYFRLELDLAIRSRKPAIVFYDQRYKDLLKCPFTVMTRQFDSSEITGAGGSPSAGLYQSAFNRFCKIVESAKAYNVVRESALGSSVCLALPLDLSSKTGYDETLCGIIKDTLRGYGYEDVRTLPWPPVLARDLFVLLNEVDWALVDVGEEMAATGLPAYLHGQFVPMLRLKRMAGPDAPKSPLENTLFGGVEVGYVKDILEWVDVSALREGLTGRLVSLGAKARRISTAAEARSYFESAALRKEAVFLSYAGRDQDLAADLSRALRRRFQKVFDYKDRGSIQPGQPWVREVFDQLSSSAVGIPLLSPEYFKSGACMHELDQMVALLDSQKMSVIPVKLYKEPLEQMPSWIQSTQYLRRTDYESENDIANEIVRLVSAGG